MYYNRDLETTLRSFARYPIVAILGPRQSGKSTLAQQVFNQHIFINLEDLELRQIALDDPKGFLHKYENAHGIILDEFQNCPQLLSYIQVIADAKNRPGYFILTGSQNFLMNEAISQSLAGRVGIVTLLPFSINELNRHGLLKPDEPEHSIFMGGYPRLYSSGFTPQELYPSYIRTYVERDIRLLVNVKDLGAFNTFIKLCAARIGQLINFSDLAVHCGISVPTVHTWLSLLEASYIIFLLRPHWTNFNKRMIKSPKIYFYDTGLACSLLDINSGKELLLNSYYGHLFEGFIIADFIKQYCNQGLIPPLYFWRDQNGSLEVDCLVNRNAELIPIEIKASQTYNPAFFKTVHTWQNLAEQPNTECYVVYAGSQSFSNKHDNLVQWHRAGQLIQQIRQG
jgi:predicted AAA+ superfamily ATPase